MMDQRIPIAKLQRSGSFTEVLKIQRKTCADVIRESKILINYDGLKSVNTKRPETPLHDSENYGNWQRAKSGDVLTRKPPANVCFTPTSGIEFELGSRPPSSFKKLDPLPADRKIRSASSGSKGSKIKQEKNSSKPVEAFQNPLSKTPTFPGRNSIRGSKLKRDCSLDEIRGNNESELNFLIEGKKYESFTSPPKKSKQILLKQSHGNIIQQEFQSKHSGHKISFNQRKASTDESRAHNHLDADRKGTSASTIKIDVTIPTLRVLSPSFNYPKSTRVNTNQDACEEEVAVNAACPNANASLKCAEAIDGNEDPNENLSSKKKVTENLRNSKLKVKIASKTDAGVIESDRNECDNNDDDDERFVSMMLEDLKLSSKVEDAKYLKMKLKNFHDELERKNLLGKKSKQRSKILKFIISLIDLDCPGLILNVSKMMLALKVTGGNLLNVTKLLVKMSSDKTNGKRFAEENMIDILRDTASWLVDSSQVTSSVESIQSMLNLFATIKHLSLNSSTAKQLVSDALVETIISSFAFSKQLKDIGNPGLYHIKLLVLLTALTRNLLDVSNASKLLTNAGVITHLFEALNISDFDESVTMNVVRVLSKLTMQSECCSEIANNLKYIKTLNNTMRSFYKHEDIVLRISFALGNLAARQEEFRSNYMSIDEHLSTVTQIYEHFLMLASEIAEVLENSGNRNNTDKESNNNELENLKRIEDILVKMVRLVANLTLNEEFGMKIIEEESCFEMVLSTLDYQRLIECEELLMNSMALINNLSFYVSPESALMKNQDRLIQGLNKFLMTSNTSCLSDIIRVFGNMSRDELARRSLAEFGADRFLIELLDSECNEVVFSTCGALINFMIDARNRRTFHKHSGVQRVIGILEVFGRNDWQLSGMACQILCNYCLGFEGFKVEECGYEPPSNMQNDVVSCESNQVEGEERTCDECSSEALFVSEEIARLKDLLHHYLEEPSMPSGNDSEMENYFSEVWKSHFVLVARDLMEKLNNYG